MRNSTRHAGRHSTQFILALFAGILVFSFQNCGQFVVDTNRSSQFDSLGATSSAGAVLVPSTDKFDSGCLTDARYDACIFRQNPLVLETSSTGNILASDNTTRQAQLKARALYGVKLTSLNSSGKLENMTLSIRSRTGDQSTTSAANLKSAPGLADTSKFEQVNTYYWMNRAAEYFDSRTVGILPAKGKGIKVIVDDTITGYEISTNTIHLKKTEAAGAIAWSGDVAVHLFGIANLMLANPAGWTSLSASKHATCNAIDKGCCTTSIGCANAIRFGVGEYFAASLFPDRTRIGEAVVNTGNPQIIAGTLRDISTLSTKTALQTFNDSAGHSQALGLIYASIWWQVRLAAGTNNSADVDRIFLEHLSIIDGSDDFRTAIAKAKTIDARLYNGRHSAAFDAELSSRGL